MCDSRSIAKNALCMSESEGGTSDATKSTGFAEPATGQLVDFMLIIDTMRRCEGQVFQQPPQGTAQECLGTTWNVTCNLEPTQRK